MCRCRCIIKAYHKWLYQNLGAHAQRCRNRVENGLQCPTVVKRSVGVEIGSSPMIPQDTLELGAAAVCVCVHCAEHFQGICKKPVVEAANVDVIP